MNTVLLAGLLLALKHFIMDGPAQTPYQYLNKGKLGHPGGILHAFFHGIGTMAVLSLVGGPWFWLGIFDGLAHYVIDYCKTNLTKKEWAERQMWMPVAPGEKEIPIGLLIKSDWYFYALVADQSLHFACYAMILAVLAK